MHVTREMVMGLIPALVRLVFRRFSNSLADDLMQLYNELQHLERELQNVRQQLADTEQRAAEAERECNQLWTILRSFVRHP